MAFPHDGRKFKSGQSGNLNGRPKKLPELDGLLADVLMDEKDGVTAARAILMALRAKASKGDVRAAELLLDRAYGKARQDISLFNKISLQIVRTNTPIEPENPALESAEGDE